MFFWALDSCAGTGRPCHLYQTGPIHYVIVLKKGPVLVAFDALL